MPSECRYPRFHRHFLTVGGVADEPNRQIEALLLIQSFFGPSRTQTGICRRWVIRR